MSLRTLLTPLVSSWLLSPERLARARARAEQRRRARGLPHEVHYFHQVDDPYSALACQALAGLQDRYDIRLVPHLVSAPADAAAPDRPRLVAYSRRDAAALARHHGLSFTDPGRQPAADALAACGRALLGAIRAGRFAQEAPALVGDLWKGALPGHTAGRGLPASTFASESADLEAALAEGDRLRARLGHYLGATFFYGGEWYWGNDRLHHLERRLQDLGAARPGVAGTLAFAPDLLPDLPPAASLAAPAAAAAATGAPGAGPQPPLRLTLEADPTSPAPVIDFFFSLRSPYSAIVMPRVFALAREQGATVRLRFLLPMVMRGLPVPAEKRRYISLDAAREARLQGVPFGRLNDPVGRPTERGLSLIPFAHAHGRAEAYLLAFMRGVWAEGLDAGSDRGLRAIVERAGLHWEEARAALADEGWRLLAERNRQDLLDLGLWGVPSFHVAGTATWGQDRLWQIREALATLAHPRESRP